MAYDLPKQGRRHRGSRGAMNLFSYLAILECLELKTFSCRPTMVADNTFQCSMAPPL